LTEKKQTFFNLDETCDTTHENGCTLLNTNCSKEDKNFKTVANTIEQILLLAFLVQLRLKHYYDTIWSN